MSTLQPSTATSPRKPGVGLLNNHAPHPTPYSDSRTSREAIKRELDGRLGFNDHNVFRRLGVNETSTDLANACVKALKGDAEVLKALQLLNDVVHAASKTPTIELEKEVEEVSEGGPTSKSRKREREMYQPISVIFGKIETFSFGSALRKYDRQWVSMGNASLTKEGDTWGFPGISPDFALLEVTEKSPRHTSFTVQKKQVSHLRRHRNAFAELKPTFEQGPYLSNGQPRSEHANPIVAQAADYARLHVSARPFQLFSVGLLIFGTHFCVAIFDRDGVQFSPCHAIWRDLDIFVRVVRRLTCDMSPVDLGQDPTVRVLTTDQAKDLKARQHKTFEQEPEASHNFPTYEVNMGQGEGRWHTVGFPIWSSLSLLGRGTAVWRAADTSGKVMVLKTAWRNGDRLPESRIYESINKTHPGVASYNSGGDLVFPGSDGRVISVAHLRGDDGAASCSPILHRLILNSVGRPIWEYTTELEWLKGVCAALKGHEFLYKQGILHRDVSAGNILLALADSNPGDGGEGFIMDVEFAHLQTDRLVTISRTGKAKYKAGPVKRGAVMTGTVQFMALEILHALINETQISHTVHHDLESFAWVIAYSFRRFYASTKKRPANLDVDEYDAFLQHFRESFGRSRITDMSLSRSSSSRNPLTTQVAPRLFSAPVLKLFVMLDYAIDDSNRHVGRPAGYFPPNPPLSYELFFSYLDEAIMSLQREANHK